MRTAVIYYSMSGNTAAAAKKVAEGIGADLIEIKLPVEPGVRTKGNGEREKTETGASYPQKMHFT